MEYDMHVQWGAETNNELPDALSRLHRLDSNESSIETSLADDRSLPITKHPSGQSGSIVDGVPVADLGVTPRPSPKPISLAAFVAECTRDNKAGNGNRTQADFAAYETVETMRRGGGHTAPPEVGRRRCRPRLGVSRRYARRGVRTESRWK